MSLVIATRSYFSRIALQSISTSVVLPEPTGPPTPTRKGGSFFVRPGMLCRWLMAVSFEKADRGGCGRSNGRAIRANGIAGLGPAFTVVVAPSRPKQPRILRLVLRRQDREHRREGLPFAVHQGDGAIHSRRDGVTELREDALAGVLAQRHGFERRLHHVL